MNKNKIILSTVSSFFIAAIAVTFVTSCASELYTPATVNAPAQTNYVPNLTAMQIGQGVTSVGQALPTPYNTLVDGLGALIIAVASTIAYRKNQQVNQHAAAAAALASVIGNNPTMQAAAMTAAAQNGSTATVAQHIASANSPV